MARFETEFIDWQRDVERRWEVTTDNVLISSAAMVKCYKYIWNNWSVTNITAEFRRGHLSAPDFHPQGGGVWKWGEI